MFEVHHLDVSDWTATSCLELTSRDCSFPQSRRPNVLGPTALWSKSCPILRSNPPETVQLLGSHTSGASPPIAAHVMGLPTMGIS